MYAEKLQCPYCGAVQDPHGFGQLERVNERGCQACGRQFVFTVTVYYQSFIEADFTETQTEETSAVDTLNRMIADASPKTERKAYVDRAIFDRFTQYCITNSKKKSEVYRKIAHKHSISPQAVLSMIAGAQNARESIMMTLSELLGIQFELTETNRRSVWTIREDKQEQQETKPVKPETHISTQINTDGMTEFEYVFGYDIIKESRKIDHADIPAYLKKLSEKKEHRDALTGKPKKWELLKVNGVSVKQEDAA